MTPEELLRRAFEARADRVQVAPDALGTIRRRIERRRSPQRRAFTWGLAYVATGTAAAVAAVVLIVGVPREQALPPGTGTGGTPTQSTTTTVPPSVATRLPVYYVATSGGRPVLYREFHPATLAADTLPARITAAVGLMLRGTAADADYTSPWPRGASVRGVRVEGGVATVDLAGAARNDVDAATARAAVQQLVWTVTAVTADRGTQTQGVRVLLGGERAPQLWGRVDISGDLKRADANQTLARLWLISPQQGDTVDRRFTVHIAGSVPEATVILRVRSSAGAVVEQQPVTLNAGAPSRGEAMVQLTLPPGGYTLEAYFESLDDGSEQALDDHAVTVR